MNILKRGHSRFLRAIPYLLSIIAALITLLAMPVQMAAQSCDNVPQGGGESISADITVRDTGQSLSETGLVPAWTNIDINSLATAFGQCIGMGWYCQQSPCVCQENGFVYERTVNHISVYLDASTAGGLNGNYFLGNVYGLNPMGPPRTFTSWIRGPRIPRAPSLSCCPIRAPIPFGSKPSSIRHPAIWDLAKQTR